MKRFLECDGTTGRVSITGVAGNDLTVNNAFSVAYWVYIGSVNNNVLPRFWEKGSDYSCIMGDSTNGKYRNLGLEIVDTNNLAHEFWGNTRHQPGVYHHGISFDGTLTSAQTIMVINGVQEVVSPIVAWGTNTMKSFPLNTLYFLSSTTPDTRNLQGRLNRIRFWNRALTVDELKADYNNQSVSSGLVGDYTVKSNSSTLVDAAGVSDGTVDASLTYRRMFNSPIL